MIRRALNSGDEMNEPIKTGPWLDTLMAAEPTDECIIWPFARSEKGYALVKRGGKMMRAHRRICEEIYGAPATLRHQAAHRCNNGHLGCVNPKHLRWATPKENMADGQRRPAVYRKRRNYSVEAIVEMRTTMTLKAIGDFFGISESYVCKLLKATSPRRTEGLTVGEIARY